MEEEEPEGEIVAGPSGEATIHDSGIMPSLFSLLLLSHAYTYIYICISIYICIYLCFFSFTYPISVLLPSFSWTDESTNEEPMRARTKEESNLEILHAVGWRWGASS